MIGRDLSKEAVAAALVLVIVASGLIIYISHDSGQTDPRDPDLLPLTGELTAITSMFILDMIEYPDDEIERELVRALPDIAQDAVVGVEGYSVSLFDVEMKIGRYDLLASISDPPSTILLPDGSYGPNSLLYGRSGGRAVIPVVQADITSGMRLDPLGQGERIFTNISYSCEIVDPNRAVLALMGIAEEEMDIGGPLARDVEYMLNSLARVRAVNKLGWLNGHSHYNVLNEGDVELALNIALAIRISSLTGQVPQALVSSIESYFTRAAQSLEMNPTGFRVWSDTERVNHEQYASLAGPQSGRRTVRGLLDVSLDRGHMDPADLFARYLYLDRLYLTSDTNAPAMPRFDMFDVKGALEESMLVNPRQYQDLRDASSMRTVVSLPTGGKTSILTIEKNGTIPFDPYIDLGIDYMVSARDFRVTGIDKVRAWYTEVDLDRTPESLINTNVTPEQLIGPVRGEGPETRCGGIVPPAKPPSHDFRMQWDLRIEGSVPLRGTVKGFLGSVLSDDGVDHGFNFSFPVRVTSWYDTLPANDGIPWFMVYKTVNLSTEVASGYIIPPEANATEFFEEYAFQAFRGAFAPLTSLGRMVQTIGTDPQDAWTRSQVQLGAVHTLGSLERWRSTLTTDQLLYMINLMNLYLQRGALIPLIEPIHMDNLVIDLSYTQFNDRLDLTAASPGSVVALSIYGLLSPPIEYKAYVMSNPGVRIDLDLSAKTFMVTWDSGIDQIREGSGRPNQPDQALLGLALEASWEIESPSLELYPPGSGGFPFESFPSQIEGKAALSFVVRGSTSVDREAKEDLMRYVVGARDIGSVAEALGILLSLAGTGDGTWSGLRARFEGGGGGMISRTLWVRGDRGSMVALSRDPWMMQAVISTIWGVNPGLKNDRPTGCNIALETAYPRGSIPDEDEVLIYQHLVSSDPGRIPGLYAFTRADGSQPSHDEWRIRDTPSTSPLW